MAEREVEQRRVVVETPTGHREYEHAESVHHPEGTGVSGGVLAAVVVGIVALAALVILFVLNRQQTDDTLANQPPQTTIVQQPAQQPPVIVEQPATTTQPAPIIINNPPAGGAAPATVSEDAAIQTAVDKKLSDDPTLSTLGITATVLNGKVTLMGAVKSEALKAQVERAVRNVKGVKAIDNQISVG
jgi:BON domain/Chorion family 3